jgi:hypothetical protein
MNGSSRDPCTTKPSTPARRPQRRAAKVTAYAFGNRYFAELEVLLPGAMTVKESHDIALELQQEVGGMGGGRQVGTQPAKHHSTPCKRRPWLKQTQPSPVPTPTHQFETETATPHVR